MKSRLYKGDRGLRSNPSSAAGSEGSRREIKIARSSRHEAAQRTMAHRGREGGDGTSDNRERRKWRGREMAPGMCDANLLLLDFPFKPPSRHYLTRPTLLPGSPTPSSARSPSHPAALQKLDGMVTLRKVVSDPSPLTLASSLPFSPLPLIAKVVPRLRAGGWVGRGQGRQGGGRGGEQQRQVFWLVLVAACLARGCYFPEAHLPAALCLASLLLRFLFASLYLCLSSLSSSIIYPFLPRSIYRAHASSPHFI